MADNGFNMQNLFARMDVTITIPTFFKKRNRIRVQLGKSLQNIMRLSILHL
jgi:hypothetical protein